jgi:UDP-N-acetylglucosamine--N-acetylmuramyl-(pentapeptide) pyrophosphoryl-undecaprenol N-acetylglucosamine transferase
MTGKKGKKKEEKKGKKEKILIVAGGTGGHIFPALAFGCWILAQKKAESVSYLSGGRPLELEIYDSQGIEPYRLSLTGSPLGSPSILRNLGRWLELPRSFFRVGRFLRGERPDMCFLFGGYVSLLPLLWCRLLGIPAVAHEQNAHAGKVTKLASRLGVPVATGWIRCRGLKSPAFTPVGVPVRPIQKIAREKAASFLGVELKEEELRVGVVGGSLGSAPLSALIEKISEKSSNLENGEKNGENPENPLFLVLGDAPDKIQGTGQRAKIQFVGRRWDMAPFYSLCDAVICRAGASTLAEVTAYDIPTLTIPWEGAADGHQEANARCFVVSTGNLAWFEGEKGNGDPNKNLNEDLNEGLEKTFSELLKRARKARDSAEGSTGAFTSEASPALWRLGELTVYSLKKGIR